MVPQGCGAAACLPPGCLSSAALRSLLSFPEDVERGQAAALFCRITPCLTGIRCAVCGVPPSTTTRGLCAMTCLAMSAVGTSAHALGTSGRASAPSSVLPARFVPAHCKPHNLRHVKGTFSSHNVPWGAALATEVVIAVPYLLNAGIDRPCPQARAEAHNIVTPRQC